MKLVLQIAIGVFLGMLGAQMTSEMWRDHQTEKQHAEREKVRLEQAERIRTLFMESQNTNGKGSEINTSPPGFVPDDAQTQLNGEQ